MGFTVWAAALVTLSPFDLALSQAVCNYNSVFGRAITRFGEWPGWLAVFCAILVVIVSRSKPALKPFKPLAFAIILLAIIHPLIITQTFKFLWGRVRFRDLAQQFENFTPFYIPAGPGAGLSFPSGHTAMAFVLSPLGFFFARKRNKNTILLCWLVVMAYGLPVAWGRIVAGAHYLSDVIFSAGFALLVAALLVRYLKPSRQTDLASRIPGNNTNES